jgi:hypothetical protein
MKENSFRFAFVGLSILAVSYLQGCALWTTVDDSALPPPLLVRQPRLLQVPDDLRRPRPAPQYSADLGTAQNQPAGSPAGVSSIADASRVSSVPLMVEQPLNDASAEPLKLLFSPYMTTSVEKHPPKNWSQNPTYDFPWIAGARPTRVNEETTLGSGDRMFGRLFAQVEFGSGAALPAVEAQVPPKPTQAVQKKSTSLIPRWLKPEAKQNPSVTPPVTPAAEPAPTSIQCLGVNCLDVARDILFKDAERKGWKVLLNRRISMHQSFQFQREDRVVWIEVNSSGDNHLKLEYALLPVLR